MRLGTIGQALTKNLGLTDSSAIVGAAPEVVPVIIAGDLTNPAQTEDILDFRLCMGRYEIGATAGNYGHLQLYNPANSGVFVVVDSLTIYSTAAATLYLTEYDTALTNNGTGKAFTDRRITGTPAAQVRQQINATILGTIIYETATPAAKTPEVIDYPGILEPGQGVVAVIGAQNLAGYFGASWAEREMLYK